MQTEYSRFARDLEDDLESTDSRRTAYFPRFQGDAPEANLALVAKISELAADKGATAGQPAAADLTLTADDLAALDAAVSRGAIAGARYGDMSHIDR